MWLLYVAITIDAHMRQAINAFHEIIWIAKNYFHLMSKLQHLLKLALE